MSRASRTAGPTLPSQPKRRAVRNNADYIVEECPPPGESWRWQDQIGDDGDAHDSALRNLRAANALEKDGFATGLSGDVYRWQIKRECYEYAKYVVARRDAQLPCGHAGLRGTGPYTCCFDFCDEEFTREEVKDD